MGTEAVGNPDFLTFESIIFFVAQLVGFDALAFPLSAPYRDSGGFDAGSVGACVWLGEGVAAYPLAHCQVGQVAPLLLLGTPLADAQGHQAGVHGQEAAHRGVGPAQLLADRGVADVVHARPAVIRSGWTRQEAQFAHALDELHRELARFVGLPCQRRYLFVGKLAGD